MWIYRENKKASYEIVMYNSFKILNQNIIRINDLLDKFDKYSSYVSDVFLKVNTS